MAICRKDKVHSNFEIKYCEIFRYFWACFRRIFFMSFPTYLVSHRSFCAVQFSLQNDAKQRRCVNQMKDGRGGMHELFNFKFFVVKVNMML